MNKIQSKERKNLNKDKKDKNISGDRIYRIYMEIRNEKPSSCGCNVLKKRVSWKKD